MVPLRRAALAGVFVVLACAQASAEQFALERRDILDPNIPLLDRTAGFHGPSRSRPRSLKGTPADLGGGASYYRMRVAGRIRHLAFQVTDVAELYVDTNGDDDLADERPQTAPLPEPAQGVDLGQLLGLRGPRRPQLTFTFGPIVVEDEAGAEVGIRVEAREIGQRRWMLRVFPAQVLAGTMRAAGREYAVSFVDHDCDGSSGVTFVPKGQGWGDWMGIDLNDDGQFADAGLLPAEVIPVPRILRLEDQWYALEVDEAAGVLRVEEVEPEFGSLDVGTRQVELTLWSDSGTYTLKGSDAPWRLPAGRYAVKALTLRATDGAGAEWTLSGAWDSGKLAAFSIEPDLATTFEIGPPLTDRIDVGTRGGTATIVFRLIGRAGEQYSPVAQRPGLDPQAPRLRITDEEGEELLAGVFTANVGSPCWYTWEIPEGFEGKFLVEAVPELGPFEFKGTGKWHEPRVVRRQPPLEATIPRGPEPIVVDADVSDWADIPKMPANLAPGGPHWMKLCWREEGIYGAARVEDDDIQPSPANPYLADCIKIRLELDFARSPIYTTNCRELALSPAAFRGPGGAHILLKNLGARTRDRSIGEDPATGMLAEWAPDEGGYVIEFFIPADALFPARVGAGTVLGLAWNLVNDRKTVHRATPNGDRWWRDPSTWPPVELGE